MSQTAQTLQNILGGAKSRGSLGEITLERLREDCLPPGVYATQYRFSSGEAADAVVCLRDKKLMPIDTKFPLDAYRRIAAEGDAARRALAAAVKGHPELRPSRQTPRKNPRCPARDARARPCRAGFGKRPEQAQLHRRSRRQEKRLNDPIRIPAAGGPSPVPIGWK